MPPPNLTPLSEAIYVSPPVSVAELIDDGSKDEPDGVSTLARVNAFCSRIDTRPRLAITRCVSALGSALGAGARRGAAGAKHSPLLLWNGLHVPCLPRVRLRGRRLARLLGRLDLRRAPAVPCPSVAPFLLQGLTPRCVCHPPPQTGRTPLFYACLVGNVLAAEELCEAGANVDYVSPTNGVSVMHTAAGNYGCGWKLVQLLHAKGADMNVQDVYGHTPLHYCKTVKGAKMICGCGIDYTIQDAKGLTAEQHHAVRQALITL